MTAVRIDWSQFFELLSTVVVFMLDSTDENRKRAMNSVHLFLSGVENLAGKTMPDKEEKAEKFLTWFAEQSKQHDGVIPEDIMSKFIGELLEGFELRSGPPDDTLI